MDLGTQLKRGYFGLAGLLLLSFGLAAAPEPQSASQAFAQKGLALHICKTQPKARWKLASTPFDIPALPSYRIKVCRA